MATTTGTRKSLLKAGAALAVCLGLATQLTPAPAHAGKKEAIIFGAIATAVIVNEAIKHEQRKRYYHSAPPRRTQPPRRTRTRRVVQTVQYDRAEAMRIQTALNTLGYNAGVVDGVIGPGTRAAIRTFQIEIDETATGVLTAKQKIILLDRASVAEAEVDEAPEVDVVTTDPVGEPIEDIDEFEEDEIAEDFDIVEVQEALNVLGYQAGPADGVMGGQTREAIIAFQIDNESEPTGILTEDDLETLLEEAEDLEDDEDLAEFDEDGPGSAGDV